MPVPLPRALHSPAYRGKLLNGIEVQTQLLQSPLMPVNLFRNDLESPVSSIDVVELLNAAYAGQHLRCNRV